MVNESCELFTCAVDFQLDSIHVGMTAGACGAMVGNPADISLIRMTADGR